MDYVKFDENKKRLELSDFPFTKRLKFAAGKVLVRNFSERAGKIAQVPFAPHHTKIDKLIRNGLYAEAFENKDYPRLRQYLSHYWGSEASQFADGWSDRFERMFLSHDSVVIDELEKWIRANDLSFNTLYEAGCGGAQVLRYLHSRLDFIDEFHGIDLGEDQINENRELHQDENLQFHCDDAIQWLKANAKPGSVFLTNGGVWEYSLREELASLFHHIAENFCPAAVAVIETVAVDHDLENEPDSFVYGRELAFSHNYRLLLSDAGFEIVHLSERAGEAIDGGGRWIRLLAVKQ